MIRSNFLVFSDSRMCETYIFESVMKNYGVYNVVGSQVMLKT